MEDFSAWIGRQEQRQDTATAAMADRLAAVLDHHTPPWRKGFLPPLGHWLCFLTDAAQAKIGTDGHPAMGGFLPPLALPRRMWAGGRIDFLADIPVGRPLDRRSTIVSITPKQGASGSLIFVTLRHEITCSNRVVLIEEQDLVYRAAADTASRPADAVIVTPVGFGDRHRIIRPDSVLLFRFSALTFNAHRIHYDRDYAFGVEHYPGLVVHAPLIATLLMDLWLREGGVAPSRFTFRATRPLLDTAPFALCLERSSTGGRLWSRDADGQCTMFVEIVAA